MKRRTLLSALLAGAVVVTGMTVASAQDSYPSRTVRVIIGFPAGGATDILTRIYVEKLNQRFNGRFVVENMPGAVSNNAAAVAARAAPDGYTLYVATNTNTTNMSLYKNLRYEFPGDFAPVAMLAGAPPVLVVNTALKINSVRELVAAAKARPGEIMYGSAGIGTGPYMAAELLNMLAQIKMAHVPYRGTNEAIADLLTGRISVILPPLPIIAGFMKDDRLKVLAVTTEKRSASAPDLPTVAESGVPGFDVTTWFGIVAPKGTPLAIRKALAEAIEDIGRGEDTRKRLAAAGGELMPLSLDGFGEYMDKDVPKWAKVIEFAGVKIQ
jgi:tripartite-type tricarboxylate transporter receptor subunit TctC